MCSCYKTILFAMIPMMGMASVSFAQGSNKRKATTTDSKNAGADFESQGEYCGLISGTYRGQRVGWQVIALGENKFRAVEYAGGLPGDGWDGRSRREFNGQRRGLQIDFPIDDDRSALLINQEIWILDAVDGTQLGLLKKARRYSPTLGARPPADGTSTEHFEGGKRTADGLLMVGAITKGNVRDFQMHLEFRTPFMPSAAGQRRGNSGVYIQRRYEVQILDSFGLSGENNECAGLYKQRKPRINMCLPPLSWQTYDIDFRAARFGSGGKKIQNARLSVRHNGVTVHDDVELTNKTGAGRKEAPTPLPILLQNHGNPVHFRNIWLVHR